MLTAVNNLGALLTDMGRLDEAEALLREALAGQVATLGEGHPDTRNTAAHLEDLLKKKRRGGGGGAAAAAGGGGGGGSARRR